MYDRAGRPSPRALRERLANLSPYQQLGYGCLGIIIASTLVLYCGGVLSLAVRPFLHERDAIPPPVQQTLPIILPTLAPTQPLLTLIPLPQVTLPPTPTQAPIPTRERPTPTLEIVFTPASTVTVSIGTLRATQAPTITTTATRR